MLERDWEGNGAWAGTRCDDGCPSGGDVDRYDLIMIHIDGVASVVQRVAREIAKEVAASTYVVASHAISAQSDI
jgi:hypothetical protein